jgi:PAS domain S-box-containing protein
MNTHREVIQRAVLIAAPAQAADGIVITDTNGNIQYVNAAFTSLTGYTSDEVVGQNPRILKSGRHPSLSPRRFPTFLHHYT